MRVEETYNRPQILVVNTMNDYLCLFARCPMRNCKETSALHLWVLWQRIIRKIHEVSCYLFKCEQNLFVIYYICSHNSVLHDLINVVIIVVHCCGIITEVVEIEVFNLVIEVGV